MTRRYWDDFKVGETFTCGPRVVTADEIRAFAAQFDPQPFHLDDAAARASPFGALAASGWHACCVVMRMATESYLADTAFLGSPGVEEVRWQAPLLAGASVTLQAVVDEMRPSRSRPGIGLLRVTQQLVDAAGDPVIAMAVTPMFERRPQ